MEALVDSGLVSSLSDLYRLTPVAVAKLERFAELSANNLVEAIQKSKTPPLAKFIAALGIRHVGIQTASALATAFGSIEKLAEATEDDLLKIPDIGQIVAESILAYFSDEDNLKQLSELKELGLKPYFEDPNQLPLHGQSYIISGTLDSMGREEAEDNLRKKGATITSGVVKTTTALIVGAKPGKSKLEKAEKLGIKIITEADFLKLIA